jgi:hypothetical protein
MTSIELTDKQLVVHMHGMDKVWALKSRFEVPRGKVVTAQVGIEPAAQAQLRKSLRLPGSYIPGLVVAGKYYSKGKWMFWDIHKGKKAITIEVDHKKYNKIVIEVADPVAAVADINAWLKR